MVVAGESPRAEIDLDLARQRFDPLQDEALDAAHGDDGRGGGLHAANVRVDRGRSRLAAETPRISVKHVLAT